MKTIRTLLILFLLGLSALAESQLPPPPPPPPPLPSGSGKINKADSLVNEGEIRGAIGEYKKMYTLNPSDPGTAYNYACALSRGSQADSAFRYLNLAVKSNPSANPLTDPDLLNLREDKRWADFENNLIPMLNSKNGNAIKDIEYAKALWRLQCMDQYCFYEIGIAVRKLGPGSPVVAALRRLQTMINDNNLKELESLLLQKGWPKRSEVGSEAAGAAFFILQHSNADSQQKYISMFEKCCVENEASWQQYALMFDRMRMNQNKPQRYGTHTYLDPKAGSPNELYPLEDDAKVEEWRREIGLEPLKDYLARTGIKSVPFLKGKYFGQKEPGTTPEIFAPGIVSVGQGVHGNIVFKNDFSEAAWHPNYPVKGRALIFIMKYINGQWQTPLEFYPKEGFNYSEPFYSYDGNKLYYLSGPEDPSGNAENEKIYVVERKGEGWSEPKLLSQNLPAFHWQFSLDRNSDLYFGGSSSDKKGEIYLSECKNGEYMNPVLLPETINSGSAEFSPFISPDNSYLVFTRMLEKDKAPPQMNLFVSFKDAQGKWTMAQNLTEKIGLPVQTPFVMMSAARVTPDGRFLFFCFFNGKGHMVYWISAKIIEDLKSKVL